MKLVFVLIAFLSFSNLVMGEVIPAGCYVADYYRDDPCWNSVDGTYVWFHSGNRATEAGYYGEAIEAVVFKGFVDLHARNECNADLNTLVDDYNSLVEAKNTCSTDLNTLVDDYNSLVNSNNACSNDFNSLVDDNNSLVESYDLALKKIKRLKAKIRRLTQ